MKTLIIKLGATGDVVRTTAILNALNGEVHWITDDHNIVMVNGLLNVDKCISWSKAQSLINSKYDLVINLEDSIETAKLLNDIEYSELFGAYLKNSDKLSYTDSSKEWFDLSIISKYGKEKADELKFKNRKTFQEMIFEGLGYTFTGEKYHLPKPINSLLKGDIAIVSKSGDMWPMKNWAYFDKLKSKLEKVGYTVNYLPIRDTLLEHISDIQNHKYLISGDSLPMHIALGSSIKCLSIFICTSPWEIYDYGLLKKIVSPNLAEYFYRRDQDDTASQSIILEEVYEAVSSHFWEKSD